MQWKISTRAMLWSSNTASRHIFQRTAPRPSLARKYILRPDEFGRAILVRVTDDRPSSAVGARKNPNKPSRAGLRPRISALPIDTAAWPSCLGLPSQNGRGAFGELAVRRVEDSPRKWRFSLGLRTLPPNPWGSVVTWHEIGKSTLGVPVGNPKSTAYLMGPRPIGANLDDRIKVGDGLVVLLLLPKT